MQWCNDIRWNACLHFYLQVQQKEVRAATMLLNKTCIIVPVLTTLTSGYSVFLCIPKEGAKMQHYNAWASYTSNFNIKRNSTIDDKVYSNKSNINFIYQVIWLLWILKSNGGNSNNEWKLADHDATFTCLLQLSSHNAKHNPKEHHQTTRKIQP
jgi:hypothetical protein